MSLPLLAVAIAVLSSALTVSTAGRLPARLTDSEFWTLIGDLSEPGGTFRSRSYGRSWATRRSSKPWLRKIRNATMRSGETEEDGPAGVALRRVQEDPLFRLRRERANRASDAPGCDAVLLCNSTIEEQIGALEALIRAAESGAIPAHRLDDAMARQRRLKERLMTGQPSRPRLSLDVVGCAAHQAVAREMAGWK